MLIIVILLSLVWLNRLHNISVRNSCFDKSISSLFPVHWHSCSCYCLDTYFDALLMNWKWWLFHLCVNTFFKTSSSGRPHVSNGSYRFTFNQSITFWREVASVLMVGTGVVYIHTQIRHEHWKSVEQQIISALHHHMTASFEEYSQRQHSMLMMSHTEHDIFVFIIVL